MVCPLDQHREQLAGSLFTIAKSLLEVSPESVSHSYEAMAASAMEESQVDTDMVDLPVASPIPIPVTIPVNNSAFSSFCMVRKHKSLQNMRDE